MGVHPVPLKPKFNYNNIKSILLMIYMYMLCDSW